MVDGQYDKLRIGAVIQARMNSTRLPGKVLMPLPLPSGKPLLLWIVEGIRRSEFINETILATSTNIDNDPLAHFASNIGISLIRGDEDDVLSRFITTIHEYSLDVVVRITGDNPLIEVGALDEAIRYHLDQRHDYTTTVGLPIGMNFEVISAEALIRLQKYSLDADDKEHVTLFIKNSNFFKMGKLHLFDKQNLSILRLTIDYPSDFAAMSLILSFYKDDYSLVSLILNLRETHPWIFEINTNNPQRFLV